VPAHLEPELDVSSPPSAMEEVHMLEHHAQRDSGFRHTCSPTRAALDPPDTQPMCDAQQRGLPHPLGPMMDTTRRR